jgi:hypothetical protein
MEQELLLFLERRGKSSKDIHLPLGGDPGWTNKKRASSSPAQLREILTSTWAGAGLADLSSTAVVVMLLTKNLPWHELETAIATVDLTQTLGGIDCRLRGRAVARLLSDEFSATTPSYDVAKRQTLNTINIWSRVASAFQEPAERFLSAMAGLNVNPGTNEECLTRFIPGCVGRGPTEVESRDLLKKINERRSRKRKREDAPKPPAMVVGKDPRPERGGGYYRNDPREEKRRKSRRSEGRDRRDYLAPSRSQRNDRPPRILLTEAGEPLFEEGECVDHSPNKHIEQTPISTLRPYQVGGTEPVLAARYLSPKTKAVWRHVEGESKAVFPTGAV